MNTYQDIFYRAVDTLDQVDPPKSFSVWFSKECLNHTAEGDVLCAIWECAKEYSKFQSKIIEELYSPKTELEVCNSIAKLCGITEENVFDFIKE